MRWLMLFILIACGKHTAPPAKDLGDNDGDQILNYKDTDKYIADIEPMDKVKGTLRFHQERTVEVGLSNEINFREDSLRFLVNSRLDKIDQEGLSEWSR